MRNMCDAILVRITVAKARLFYVGKSNHKHAAASAASSAASAAASVAAPAEYAPTASLIASNEKRLLGHSGTQGGGSSSHPWMKMIEAMLDVISIWEKAMGQQNDVTLYCDSSFDPDKEVSEQTVYDEFARTGLPLLNVVTCENDIHCNLYGISANGAPLCDDRVWEVVVRISHINTWSRTKQQLLTAAEGLGIDIKAEARALDPSMSKASLVTVVCRHLYGEPSSSWVASTAAGGQSWVRKVRCAEAPMAGIRLAST